MHQKPKDLRTLDPRDNMIITPAGTFVGVGWTEARSSIWGVVLVAERAVFTESARAIQWHLTEPTVKTADIVSVATCEWCDSRIGFLGECFLEGKYLPTEDLDSSSKPSGDHPAPG